MRINFIFIIHKQIIFKTIFDNVNIKFISYISFNFFFSTISIIIINSLNKMFSKMINITKILFCFILINLIKRCDVKNYRIFRDYI